MTKYFLLLFLVINVVTYSQKCATPSFSAHIEHHNIQERISQHLNRTQRKSSNNEIYTIPVVFHIVHDNNTDEIGGRFNSNISEEQIMSQMEVLNADFRRKNADTSDTPLYFEDRAVDSYIQFCLATTDPDGNPTTGITRVKSNFLPFNVNSDFDMDKLKSANYWPSDQYLNVWVTELSSGVIGFAQFPSGTDLDGLEGVEDEAETDGVVMDHRAFGTVGTVENRRYQDNIYGRTLTHEIGHWLGLIHIWGDSETCAATDYVEDTPPQEEDNITLDVSCGDAIFECGSEIMYMNYMDYTPDACMNMFSQGQVDRMRAVLEVDPRRNSLLSSIGCCGSGKKFALPFQEYFDDFFEENSWEIESSDSSMISYAHNELEHTFEVEVESSGYIDFTSQILEITNLNSIYFLLDLVENTNHIDSVEFYFDNACSGDWLKFNTAYPNDFEIIEKYNQPKARLVFTSDELNQFSFINVRIRIYANGDFALTQFEVRDGSTEIESTLKNNPTINAFSVFTQFLGKKDVSIKIFDVNGRLVNRFVSADTFEQEQIVNFYPNASGLYILHVKVDNELFKYKLVVE